MGKTDSQDIKAMVNRINMYTKKLELGDHAEITINTAYGKWGVYSKSQSHKYVSRLTKRELYVFLDGMEAGLEMILYPRRSLLL